MFWIAACDSSSRSPTWLHLEATKTQAARLTWEGCFWLNHLRWEDPPQIWATPSGGSAHQRTWEKEAFALHLPTSHSPASLSILLLRARLCWYYKLLLPDTNVDRRPATLQESSEIPTPDWDCWDQPPTTECLTLPLDNSQRGTTLSTACNTPVNHF